MTPFGYNLKDWRSENLKKKGSKAGVRAEIDISSVRILVGAREEAEGRVNPSLMNPLFISISKGGAETHVRGVDCTSFMCYVLGREFEKS